MASSISTIRLWQKRCKLGQAGDANKIKSFQATTAFQPNIQEWAIAKAVQEDGAEVVLGGVTAFAEAVKNGYNFIPAAEKFFGDEKRYLKDLSMWLVKPKVEDKPKPKVVHLTRKMLAENMGLTLEEFELYDKGQSAPVNTDRIVDCLAKGGRWLRRKTCESRRDGRLFKREMVN